MLSSRPVIPPYLRVYEVEHKSLRSQDKLEYVLAERFTISVKNTSIKIILVLLTPFHKISTYMHLYLVLTKPKRVIDTREIFVSKTVDESNSARVLVGCKLKTT